MTKKQIQNLVIRLALTAICLKFTYLLLVPALWFIWFARDGQGIWIIAKPRLCRLMRTCSVRASPTAEPRSPSKSLTAFLPIDLRESPP